MICEWCRRDVHIYCPELARIAAAEPAQPPADGKLCDCTHEPRRAPRTEPRRFEYLVG